MSEFYEKNWMINPSQSLNLLQKYLLYLFPIICYASDVKLSYVCMISLFIFTVIFCFCKKGSSCDSVTKANKPLALIIPVSVTAAMPHVAQWPRLYDRHTDGVSSLWNTVTQRLRHRKSAVTESITKKTGQKNSSAEVLKRLSQPRVWLCLITPLTSTRSSGLLWWILLSMSTVLFLISFSLLPKL